MTRADLLLALWRIGKRLGLTLYYTHYDNDHERSEIEALAHELAHRLEAGPDFAKRINAASPGDADAHEFAAQRIESAALHRLGQPVSLRRLWPNGEWRDEQPAWSALSAPLTDRERKCVRAFVRMVAETSTV